MDGRPMLRLRWRMHGAYMWPTFVLASILDAALAHWLPLQGDHESPVSGWLIGVFVSLLGIILLSPVLGYALRRARGDMPRVVARDYAGTAVVLSVTAVLAIAGLLHHDAVTADQRALQDAIGRAEAYIASHAPRAFRVNVQEATAFVIQGDTIYRACVPNVARTRTYCVVVRREEPWARSVTFSGYEPNSVMSEGTG